MHLVYHPKFCITIVCNFQFLLGITVVPRESKTTIMQNLGGGVRGGGGGGRLVNKVHYGLCENGELSLSSINFTYPNSRACNS